MKRKIIGYSGNIGSGKTTRAEREADIDTEVVYEEVEENFILEQFYKKPSEYAYMLELYVILSRFNKRECALRRTQADVVEDRAIFDDMIFVKLLHDDGIIDEWSYGNIKSIFAEAVRKMTPYTEIIWLKVPAETLIKRIARRGREMEKKITVDYLKKLENVYEEIFMDLIPKETKLTIVVPPEEELLRKYTLE